MTDRKALDKYVMPVVHRHGEGALEIVHPENVLEVNNKVDLQHYLDFYRRPMIALYIETEFARRYYVERIRPVLRFYCEYYEVEVPAWLKDDSHYKEMDPAQLKKLFGDRPLEYRRFRPLIDPAKAEKIKGALQGNAKAPSAKAGPQ